MLIPQPLPAAFTSQTFWVVTGGKRRRVFGDSRCDSRCSVSGASHIVQSWVAEAIRKEAQPVLNGDSKRIDPLQKAPIRLNIPLAKENAASASCKEKTLPKEGLPTTVRPKSDKDSLMKALSERNWKEAYQEFRNLPDTRKTSLEGWGMHSTLLILICSGSSWRASWEVYTSLKPLRLSYSSLAALLTQCIKSEELIRGLEIFRDMQSRGMKPNITTWCYLISALSKSSKRKGWPYAENAYKLWKELEGTDYVKGNIDASYYATGVLACTRHGEMQEAESILETVMSSGLADIRIFNMLIKGYAQTSIESMERVIERMKTLKVKPIISTYNTLIDAYSSKGLMKEAHQVMETALKADVALDIWTYSCLLKGYVKSRDMDGVDSVLDVMKLAGVKPNVVTMTNLLDGCVNAGLMTEAEDLMQSMRAAEIQPNIVSYNSLVRGHALAGNVEAVKKVLLQMTNEGISPREDTYNTLMRAALSSRNAEKVPELFDQLVSLSLRPNSLSFTTLIAAFARMQNPSNAAGAFRRMKDNIGVDRIALNALISAFANADRMKEAESQLQRAASIADSEGLPPPIEAYGAVVKAYARQRDVDAAMDCFYEFQERGGEPDEGLLNMIVTACVRAGQYKRALQFVRSMERAGKNMNKARLKQTLEVVLRLQDQAMRKNKRHQRNQNLERFKFWLGLPNTYYSDNEDLDWPRE